MEFHIALTGPAPDMARLHAAIAQMDPSAVLDRDPLGQHLRVSTHLSANQVHDAAHDAGWELASGQIVQQASNCCGGCGG